MSYFRQFFLYIMCSLCFAKDFKNEFLDLSLHTSEISAYTISDDTASPTVETCSQDFVTIEKNEHILMKKLETIKIKLDNLEKQQRDFLSLISDIVMKPSHPTAAQEHNDYQTNLDLMKAQQYSQALKLWKKFVQDYPSSDKIAYAYYWMGELYNFDEKSESAKECYQHLIDQYPAHPKTPEAFLKIGQLEMRLGHKDKAKFLFRTLIQQYPYAQATHLAKKSLVDLNKPEESIFITS